MFLQTSLVRKSKRSFIFNILDKLSWFTHSFSFLIFFELQRSLAKTQPQDALSLAKSSNTKSVCVCTQFVMHHMCCESNNVTRSNQMFSEPTAAPEGIRVSSKNMSPSYGQGSMFTYSLFSVPFCDKWKYFCREKFPHFNSSEPL